MPAVSGTAKNLLGYKVNVSFAGAWMVRRYGWGAEGGGWGRNVDTGNNKNNGDEPRQRQRPVARDVGMLRYETDRERPDLGERVFHLEWIGWVAPGAPPVNTTEKLSFRPLLRLILVLVSLYVG